LILATVLAFHLEHSVQQVIVNTKSGIKTWDSMVEAAGIDRKNLAQAVASVLENSDFTINQAIRRQT